MSRVSIVAMLVAAEILIAGMAIFVLGGSARPGHFHGPLFAAGMHRVDFVAKPIAPIQAGNSPRIAVDDPESRVVVATSNDGLVHVKDLTNVSGAFFTDRVALPQLDVRRTADGVSVSRQGSNRFGVHFQMGSFDQRVEIEVPAGSHVDVARCSGAEVSGVEGGVAVHSQDGRITLADLSGTVDARADNGSISATRVRGDALTLQSGDGRLSLTDVTVASLSAQTNDGRIEARDLAIAGGSQPHAALHSDDGSIRVGLAPGADVTVDASTSDGKVLVDGASFKEADGDAAQHTVRLGNGSGSLKITSNDGSIHILTNGAV